MIKLHTFSQRRKSRGLIIAKKKREIPQVSMSLNCQNQRKEMKVCGQNVIVYMGMGKLIVIATYDIHNHAEKSTILKNY
jgi:hypothetical protein